ncbi:DsbA family protein [Streptomyces sp. NBC_01304]|uniref:DsbA family protein n=1 Tax=Streptomyces sp. NBC_01304 TaxID=2903818 RepID=UPI002E0D4876|nr:DsbA family protein [Streptomyces sp. NBC_01304]
MRSNEESRGSSEVATHRAARSSHRRKVLVGAAAASALALAAGGAWLLFGSGEDGPKPKPLVLPANVSGTQGTVVTQGKLDAQHTIQVFMDPRCPACASTQKVLGRTIRELADKGTHKVEYHFVAFTDKSLGGTGSKQALNALGAAANESPEKFLDFVTVLYENQPAVPRDDKFSSSETLLRLADKVEGLRTPAFEKAVNELTYEPWAEKATKVFKDAGVTSTPTVHLDGHPITVLQPGGQPVPVKNFTQQVTKSA